MAPSDPAIQPTSAQRDSFHSLHLFGGEEVQVRIDDPYASSPPLTVVVAHIELTGDAAVIEACGRSIVHVIDETHSTVNQKRHIRKVATLWWHPRFGHVDTLNPATSITRDYDLSSFPVGAIGGLAAHGVHRFEIRAGDEVAVTHMVDPTSRDTHTTIRINQLRVSGRASTVRNFGTLLAELSTATMGDKGQMMRPWRMGGAWKAAKNPGASTRIRPSA